MSIVVDQLKMTPPAALTSTAASQVVQLTAGGNLILALPGSGRFSANSFTVYAAGYAQSGPGTFTATVQPILYGDASLATVTTKPLFTSTAGTLAYTGTAAAGASIPWAIYANIVGDQVSGTFTGEAESQSARPTKSALRWSLPSPPSTSTPSRASSSPSAIPAAEPSARTSSSWSRTSRFWTTNPCLSSWRTSSALNTETILTPSMAR